MSDILDREKADRPNNEGMIRGIEKWKYPSNYMGTDYEGYYILYSMDRDSDYLTVSNFETILKLFEDIGVKVIEDYDMSDDKHPSVINVRMKHWLVGWIDTIMIHEDSSLEIWNEGVNINNSLSDYPVLDDDDYYQKEYDIIDESYESYIKNEFMDIIKKHYDLYDIEEKEDILSKTYLDELIDLSNTEYIIENNSAHVYNIESIIEYLDIEKVKEYFNIEFFEEE